MPGDNETTARLPMSCEEFGHACLELHSACEDSAARQALMEHERQCPHCAALQANLQTLQDDLRVLGHENLEAEAPQRVQMRVMQEFRTRHRTMKARQVAWIVSWGMAAAAMLVTAVSWTNWRHERGLSIWPGKSNSAEVGSAATAATSTAPVEGVMVGETLVAANNSGDFTLLPGSTPLPMEDATVVRVQMQRGALQALGFTVNEERASDLIQVDLLVGDDGLPQAVRLPESAE